MTFQKTILIVATVVLIITLVVIGIYLSKAKKEEYWPPMVGSCPDYWVDLDGNGTSCFNKNRLGTCNLPSKSDKNTMDFTKSPFIGQDGTCAKYKWANKCGVTWDGITSGVSNPCSTA